MFCWRTISRHPPKHFRPLLLFYMSWRHSAPLTIKIPPHRMAWPRSRPAQLDNILIRYLQTGRHVASGTPISSCSISQRAHRVHSTNQFVVVVVVVVGVPIMEFIVSLQKTFCISSNSFIFALILHPLNKRRPVLATSNTTRICPPSTLFYRLFQIFPHEKINLITAIFPRFVSPSLDLRLCASHFGARVHSNAF